MERVSLANHCAAWQSVLMKCGSLQESFSSVIHTFRGSGMDASACGCRGSCVLCSLWRKSLETIAWQTESRKRWCQVGCSIPDHLRHEMIYGSILAFWWRVNADSFISGRPFVVSYYYWKTMAHCVSLTDSLPPCLTWLPFSTLSVPDTQLQLFYNHLGVEHSPCCLWVLKPWLSVTSVLVQLTTLKEVS